MKAKLSKNLIRMSKYAVYSIILQSVFCTIALSHNSEAQVKRLNEIYLELRFDKVPLQNALEKIERNTEFTFAYILGDLPDSKITLSNKKRSMEEILLSIAEQSGVSFRRVKETIHVKKSTDRQNKLEEIFNANLQNTIITGKVTSFENDDGLPGASVIEKGTSNGTITDFEGNFSLEVSGEVTLIISFVGYISKEVSVGAQTDIKVSLEEDVSKLDEVVVVGYGVAKKSDLTGSVVRANIEAFENQANTNILQSLQGTVPGLNVGVSTSAGDPPSYSIRGQNNLSSDNNSPLIVVDGIIYRGNINDLNPDDIKSVDVLKDASSTAIYGSQAANGVIIISTKTGTSEKPTISYSTRLSIRGEANPMEYYNRDEYIQLIEDFHWMESRLGPDYTSPNPDFDPLEQIYPAEYDGYQAGANVIWQDLVTRQGFLQNHNVSVSGKSDKVNYFVSGSYLDQEEVLVGDNYQKITGKVNLDASINDWLKIGTNTFLTTADHSGVEFPFFAKAFSPYSRPFDEDGNIVVKPSGGFSDNPYLNENEIDVDKRFQINSVLFAEVSVPWIEGLSYRMNYGHSYRTIRQNNFSFVANNFNGGAIKSFDLFYDWTIDNILSYNNTFGDHSINATLLYGREERYGEGTDAIGDNYSIRTLGFHSLENADIETIQSSAFDESSLYSMARLNYTFKEKYLITGTIRRDGFSGFGSNNKIGVFPSVAVGWTVSEESFFSPIVDQLSYLKLRASYGTSGNRGIGRYGTLAQVNVRDGYVFGDGGSTLLAQNVSTFAAPDLAWESTTGTNIGLDYELFNGRLSGSMDYYNNNTDNILFTKPLPSITGLDGVSANIGEVHNEGFEFILRSNIININSLSWSAQFNFSRNTNEIVSILGNDSDGDGEEDNLEDAGLFIGESIGTVFGYQVDGFYQIGDDIPAGSEPGFLILNDTNGDGTINSNDRVILGRAEPAYQFGISNTIKYKQFQLFFFINSIQGGKDGYLGNNSPWEIAVWNDARGGRMESNRPKAWDYWSPDNTESVYPSLRFTSPLNPKLYYQRNFIRLQDINLSYSFSRDLLQRLGISQLKLFVSSKNLATITDWVGMDPQSGQGMAADGRPLTRSYTLGLNVSF